MKEVIRVENLSKAYRVGQKEQSHDTLFGQIADIITSPVRNFKNLRSLTKFNGKDDPTVHWALKDINFTVHEGEVLGIIGHNGAGKSTLLKILSRVTEPTSGRVRIRGRIGALLEVGTGFHPELTGRENIYMNGTILGMTKKEIDRKLDEIIDFAGVEKFIDTPVKFYSSGMKVRLGFSVAAHLEPEILVIDEVLAVGDAEFQKKCLGKMKDVSTAGRTVLFVSHNMLAVRTLCNKGIILKNGFIKLMGDIEEVCKCYSEHSQLSSFVNLDYKNEILEVKSIKISDNGKEGYFNIDEKLYIDVEINFFEKINSIHVNLFIKNSDGILIFANSSDVISVLESNYIFNCKIPADFFNDDLYIIDLMVVARESVSMAYLQNVMAIHGFEPVRKSAWKGKYPGLIRPKNFIWTIQNQNSK